MNKSATGMQKTEWSLPNWFYLLFVVVVTAQVVGSFLLEEESQKKLEQNMKVSDLLNRNIQNIQLYHLWLEEYLTHPDAYNQRRIFNNFKISHSSFKELQGLIQQPYWKEKHPKVNVYTKQLEGQLKELFELGQQRMLSPRLSGISSPMDDTFDAQFIRLMGESEQLQNSLREIFKGERAATLLHKRMLLAFEMIAMIGIWLMLIVVDRRRVFLLEKIKQSESERWGEELQHRSSLEESIANKNTLLKQKEKLNLFFEQTPLGIIEWTPDFKVVMWNPAAERIFGFSEAEAVGRKASELILNESLRLEVVNPIKELITNTGYRNVNHNVTKDGRIILCDWYNAQLFDDNDNMIGISSMVIDITEQRKLEKMVDINASRMNEAQRIAHFGSWELNMETNELWWSDEVYRIFGLDSKTFEASYDAFLNAIHPEDRDLVSNAYSESVETKQPYEIIHRLQMADKEIKHVQEKCSTFYNSDGVAIRSVGTIQDITERIEQEQETLKFQSKLEHTQRLESLGVLAGGIAHDFNNILTGILGNTALASGKLDSSSPIRSYLQNVEDSSHRAAELCKQMLAYSGKGKFIITVIDLNQMINEIIRLMEVSIDKGVVLKYHLSKNLPMVEGDAAQLQQVLMNLIINASEAIEGKSGVISISTGIMSVDASYLENTTSDEIISPLGRYVYVEVSDTGCGMDKATQKKIFDPFFTTKFTGRGLGMSAILGIIHGHEGSIKCYSEVDQGTSFKVLLPCSDKNISNVGEINQSRNEKTQLSGTVLIVDDEETIREVAGMMFEEMGFDVLKANDGHEGVSLFHQHHKDIKIVLLDMTMPRMDGVEAFREMQRIDSDVKVVLSSGYNEQDATNRFTGKGLAGFIQKPYLPSALQQTVRDILSK